MELKVLWSVLVLFISFGACYGQNEVISCRYYISASGYTCDLTIRNTNGWNNFTGIAGTHMVNRTNADIRTIIGVTGTTRNVPSIICDTFPLTTRIELQSFFIQTVNDYSFRNCGWLTLLDLHRNRIVSIDDDSFTNNTDLRILYLDSNLLTTLPDKVFANLQRLSTLTLQWNRIATLPSNASWFSGLTSLNLLDLSLNRIQELPLITFESLGRLQSLYLDFNRISSLTVGIFEPLTALAYLSMNFNQLTELPVGVFTPLVNLRSLDLRFNKIQQLGPNLFSPLDRLIFLDLDFNRISNLTAGTFNSLGNLYYLELAFNQISSLPSDIFQPLTRLASLSLRSNRISSLPEDVFTPIRMLWSLELQSNLLTELPSGIFDPLTNLRILYLNRNSITSLQSDIFESLTFLATLNLESNRIQELPSNIFAPLVNLEYLYLHFNKLTRLSPGLFDSLTRLTELTLHGNQITELPAKIFDSLSSMQTLHLYSNQLEELPPYVFNYTTSLTELGLGWNRISSLTSEVFENLSSLQNLRLSSNLLQNLPAGIFNGLTSLRSMDLRRNQLSQLPPNIFSNLVSLQALSISSNNLTSLSPEWFKNLTSLERLYVNSNQIEELPMDVFSSLVSLRTLSMYGNRIKLLHAGSFGALPYLTNALFLNNQIDAIDEDLIDNTGLSLLGVRNNLCVNAFVWDTTETRLNMRTALATCFDHFVNGVPETSPSPPTTTAYTTAPQQTTTESLPPGCAAGNLNARVCSAEDEIDVLKEQNQDLLLEIKNLHKKNEELEKRLESSTKHVQAVLDELQYQIRELKSCSCSSSFGTGIIISTLFAVDRLLNCDLALIIIIIWCLISSCSSYYTKSSHLECSYMSWTYDAVGNIYICSILNDLNILSIESAFIKTAIGDLSSSKSNDQVLGITETFNQIHFFPRGLNNVFKRLKLIEFKDCGLLEIHKTDLMPLTRLEYLNLDNNEIQVIEDELFDLNPSMRYISFKNNKIFEVHPEVFDHLTKLRYLIMERNRCINMYANDSPSQVKQVIQKIQQSCPSPGNVNSRLSTSSDGAKLMRISIKLDNFGSDLRSCQNSILGLSRELAGMERSSQALNADMLRKLEAAEGTLRAAHAENSQRILNLDTKVTSLEQSITALDIQSIQSRTANLEASINALKAADVETSKKLQNIEKALNTTNEDLQNFRTAIMSALQEINTKLDENSNKIEAIGAAQMDVMLTSLNASQNQAFLDINDKIRNLGGELSVLKTTFDEVNKAHVITCDAEQDDD
ncbi:uncharacterized protein [Chironomus tepperi]|uniref:uncharacterized protein n=1 Tax=Chironomus tepperi TaxID=113505 RepID=UPI00391F6165